MPTLARRTLADLTITDEPSFRHVSLYGDLKQALLRGGAAFRVAPPNSRLADWNRAVFLNLTYWGTGDASDVLVSEHIPADVVAHVAWHHLARKAFGPTADALLLGEAIASAFDLYLVGRLLGHAPDADFLATQVPSMADVAASAGLEEGAFEALLNDVARDPERAFEELRALLFDAATALVRCDDVEAAAACLATFDKHRMAPLIHHYELSNWVLYVRAYAAGTARTHDPAPRGVDAALRAAPVSLDWLEQQWVRPAAR